MKLSYIGNISADSLPQNYTPFFAESVPVGFPSPANDYLETPIDLNQYLIKNQVATFLVKASGDSMINANIGSGAVLIVDRSIKPNHNDIVVASIDGEFLCKRLQLKPRIELIAENAKYQPIFIEQGHELEVIGVVTAAINIYK